MDIYVRNMWKKVLIEGILRVDFSIFSKISKTILLFNDNIVLNQTGR